MSVRSWLTQGLSVIAERPTAVVRCELRKRIALTPHPTMCALCVFRQRSARFVSIMAGRSDKKPAEKHLSEPIPPVKCANPMEILHQIFHRNKQAVLQHRELLICLAEGDVDGAGATAAALTRTIKKSLLETVKPADSMAESSALPECLFRRPDDDALRVTTDKIADTLMKNNSNPIHDENLEKCKNSAPDEDSVHAIPAAAAPWNVVSSLRAVVLETLFETVDPEDPMDSSMAHSRGWGAGHSSPTSTGYVSRAEEILNQYLSEEGEKWKEQKHLIASILLDLVKSMELTPLDLHACEETEPVGELNRIKKEAPLNPLKHANLVVRGELPDFGVNGNRNESAMVIETECQKELEELKKKIVSNGAAPMTPVEEEMALYELRRCKTVIRYSVGIHRDLQRAFNKSKNVSRFIEQNHKNSCQPLPTGAEYFVSQAIHLLNSDAHKEILHRIKGNKTESSISIETPVIPFTFMLKCCLWFEV